jgi:hypothetical protein
MVLASCCKQFLLMLVTPHLYVVQGVSIEKLEDLYATAMDYGITLVTISHEPGTLLLPLHQT